MKKKISPSVVFLCPSLFSHAAQCCIFQHDNMWGELPKTEGGITLEGVIFLYHSRGNSYSEFQQVTHFWWVYSLVIFYMFIGGLLLHQIPVSCFFFLLFLKSVDMFTWGEYKLFHELFWSHEPLCDYGKQFDFFQSVLCNVSKRLWTASPYFLKLKRKNIFDFAAPYWWIRNSSNKVRAHVYLL